MAHPLLIIDQAMYQFSSQWYAGLKPSLEIRTEYDGRVVVNSKMQSSNRSPINWWEKGTSQFPFSSTSRSKRAKKNARYRRNKARKMEASKSRITTTDVETQYSDMDGSSFTKTEITDSGFNERSPSNPQGHDLVGRDFNEKDMSYSASSKATSVPSDSPDKGSNDIGEVLPDLSTAIHWCEGCLKEFGNKALENYPVNSTCKDCSEAHKSLDPTEMPCHEETSDASPEEIALSLGLSTHCTDCNEEYTCPKGIRLCEHFFGSLLRMKNVKSQWNLLCNGNLKEEKKTKNKKKKKRNLDPNACEFCCEERMDVKKISNMVELVRSVEMSENLPCENCM